MKFLWLFFAVYCHFVNADEISPQTVVENYFESFNNMDRAALNALSGEPFIFVRAGKASVYSKYGDAVDFDGIKASGRFRSIDTWGLRSRVFRVRTMV